MKWSISKSNGTCIDRSIDVDYFNSRFKVYRNRRLKKLEFLKSGTSQTRVVRFPSFGKKKLEFFGSYGVNFWQTRPKNSSFFSVWGGPKSKSKNYVTNLTTLLYSSIFKWSSCYLIKNWFNWSKSIWLKRIYYSICCHYRKVMF